ACATTLVDDNYPRAVPREHFHDVAALADEHKQRSTPWLHRHPLAYDGAEALVTKAHVDRLKRDVDGQARCDHDSSSVLSAATTLRNSSASNPASTRIRTAPSSTTTRGAADASGVLRTSGANSMTGAGPLFCSSAHQRYAVALETSTRVATAHTASPLRCISARNFDRSRSPYRRLMPDSVQARSAPRKDGPH